MCREPEFIFLSSIFLSKRPGGDKQMGAKKMRRFTPEHSARNRYNFHIREETHERIDALLCTGNNFRSVVRANAERGGTGFVA
jgi:hypothetical protein